MLSWYSLRLCCASVDLKNRPENRWKKCGWHERVIGCAGVNLKLTLKTWTFVPCLPAAQASTSKNGTKHCETSCFVVRLLLLLLKLRAIFDWRFWAHSDLLLKLKTIPIFHWRFCIQRGFYWGFWSNRRYLTGDFKHGSNCYRYCCWYCCMRGDVERTCLLNALTSSRRATFRSSRRVIGCTSVGFKSRPKHRKIVVAQEETSSSLTVHLHFQLTLHNKISAASQYFQESSTKAETASIARDVPSLLRNRNNWWNGCQCIN